jgi:hypothetical protein
MAMSKLLDPQVDELGITGRSLANEQGIALERAHLE